MIIKKKVYKSLRKDYINNVTKDEDNTNKYLIITGLIINVYLGVYLGWDYLPKPSINWILIALGLISDDSDNNNNNNNNNMTRDELEEKVLQSFKNKNKIKIK